MAGDRENPAVNRAELIAAVDAEFETIAVGMDRWPDPHPFGKSPEEDEYSRTTNPERFRIVGARCEAWVNVLAETGLCAVERNAAVQWADGTVSALSRQDRVAPHAKGALPLVVARRSNAAFGDFGVMLGAGTPAVLLGVMPRCGCDACDDGSQHELDEVDRKIFVVVSGAFRRLARKDRQITVEDGGWSASAGRSGRFGVGEVEAILADPKGWAEVSGAPWGVGG